jgi:hypothetical protein
MAIFVQYAITMTYAVLTGDIVGSSLLIDEEERMYLTEKLKECLSDITGNTTDYYLHRGDYFQVLIRDYTEAVKYALMIRSFLKSRIKTKKSRQKAQIQTASQTLHYSIPKEEKVLSRKTNAIEVDARIAIGIGDVNFIGKNIAESDGTAFQHSGRTFDKLERGQFLAISGPRKMFTSVEEKLALEVICAFIDDIAKGWTPQQAEAIIELLYAEKMGGIKQINLADVLGIKQPTLSERLKLAKWSLIKKAMSTTAEIIANANHIQT